MCGSLSTCRTTTMFSSFLLSVAVLASVHSFTFVAATQEAPLPEITPPPAIENVKRQVAGGPGTPILSTIEYPYTALPEQVYPFPVLRGPQFGYNICNSSTQGNNSLCQTLIVNSPVRILFSFFSFFNSVCRVFSTILPNRATFVYGAHLHQMAPLETRKLES